MTSPSSVRSRQLTAAFLFAAALTLSGCVPAATMDAAAKRAKEADEERAAAEKKGSIIRKTTQDIKKYDPDAGRQVSDLKVRAQTPVLYPLEAYGPIVGQIATLNIDMAVQRYEITNNKWPNYEEFMRDIIKGEGIHLPVLPAKAEYHYDEANHKLVVVEYEAPKEGAKDGEPKGEKTEK